MKKTKLTYLITLATMLTLAACHDDEVGEYNFNATMEQPTSTDSSKVFLQNERYVYWEVGDKINIFGDNGDKKSGKPVMYEARLVDASNIGGETGNDFGFFNGVFITTMPWGSKYFLGLYPKNDGNAVSATTQNSNDFGTVSINLTAEQGLRTDERGDITFNNNVFPMVAWYGGEWTNDVTAYNLDFHSLASIVRIQLFNSTGSEYVLDSIEFSSRNDATQLSGLFTIRNYKTEDPSLVSTALIAGSNTRVAIANKDGSSLGLNMSASSLRSFYLVLPAFKGRHETTTFELTMTVHATQNGVQKSFDRNLTVKTRRNGITYMRAVSLNNWTSGEMSAGLVGNGTEERPFKIYTVADLVYLRTCYNGANRTINNQPITENTYIHIMRSDLALRPTNWTAGINNFVGHMSYTTTGTNTVQAILNNSSNPLFNSIGAQGHVEGITVNCDTNYNLASSNFSPFCNTNNGEIKNCRVMSAKGGIQGSIIVQTPGGSPLYVGGLCLTNTGTISGSGCVAHFDAEWRSVGGVCHTNSGTIEGCYVASTMGISRAASVGGICHTNNYGATVRDCYFANIMTNATYDIGGIVYENKGTVRHCYLSETSGIVTTGSVGGIVNTQTHADAKVDYCWSDGSLRGSRVGLIAASVSAGTIVNSFCNNNGTIVTLQTTDDNHYGGGLVGLMSGGTLENSFVYINKVQRINNLGTIGGLVGRIEGAATVKNSYCYETTVNTPVLYGEKDNLTAANPFTNCFIVGGTTSPESGISFVGTADGYLDNMRLALNGNSNPPSDPPAGWNNDWKRWVPASATSHVPVLDVYSK